MRNFIFALVGATTTAFVSAGTASAFPAAPLAVTTPVEQVRVVCDQWGRCWRTGPRYYRYGYGPRRYWGPGYGAYGGPYFGGPYYGPGIAFGGPGFGFRFGY